MWVHYSKSKLISHLLSITLNHVSLTHKDVKCIHLCIVKYSCNVVYYSIKKDQGNFAGKPGNYAVTSTSVVIYSDLFCLKYDSFFEIKYSKA